MPVLKQLTGQTGTPVLVHDGQALAGVDERPKALVFFGLLERGVFLARRGLMALSLPFDDAQCEVFAAALASVLQVHGAVLPRAR